MGVSKKSVSWTSRFVTMGLQENGRRSNVTFLVQTFWTPPYAPLYKMRSRAAFWSGLPELTEPSIWIQVARVQQRGTDFQEKAQRTGVFFDVRPHHVEGHLTQEGDPAKRTGVLVCSVVEAKSDNPQRSAVSRHFLSKTCC